MADPLEAFRHCKELAAHLEREWEHIQKRGGGPAQQAFSVHVDGDILVVKTHTDRAAGWHELEELQKKGFRNRKVRVDWR